jgi:hypothetical protein
LRTQRGSVLFILAETYIAPCFPIADPFRVRVLQCFQIIPILGLIDLHCLLHLIKLSCYFVHVFSLRQAQPGGKAVDQYAVALVLLEGLNRGSFRKFATLLK